MTKGCPTQLRWLAVALVVVIWAISLALPALAVEGAGVLTGWDVLKVGWQGIGVKLLAWYANPLFAVGVVAFAGRLFGFAGVVSGFGLVLALTSFAAREIAAGSGFPLPALTLKVGFFVWLASLCILLVISWRCWALAAVEKTQSNGMPGD